MRESDARAEYPYDPSMPGSKNLNLTPFAKPKGLESIGIAAFTRNATNAIREMTLGARHWQFGHISFHISEQTAFPNRSTWIENESQLAESDSNYPIGTPQDVD